MENYLTLDIENQRYMDSFQLMSSNLGAELCKEEKINGKFQICKKLDHLY